MLEAFTSCGDLLGQGRGGTGKKDPEGMIDKGRGEGPRARFPMLETDAIPVVIRSIRPGGGGGRTRPRGGRPW